MNHLFIINPAAGKGRSMKYIPLIEKSFKGSKENCFIEITQKPGHAAEIAKRYVSSDIHRVYSVGGDGTLNEVLNGVAGSGSSLAVIPCGSGNDLVRSFDYGLGKAAAGTAEMDSVLQKVLNGEKRKVDLARVNDKYFINIASVGMDAEVAYAAAGYKRLPGITGGFAYVLGILTTAFKYRSSNMSVSVDGTVIRGRLLLAAVANGKYYGGGMMPAPGARIDDGLFDVCVVGEIGKLKILRLFPEYMKGRHGKIEGVSFLKGSRVEIRCERETAMNTDGEVERVRNAVFEIIPGGIDLVVPE